MTPLLRKSANFRGFYNFFCKIESGSRFSAIFTYREVSIEYQFIHWVFSTL